MGAHYASQELRADNMLRGLGRERFIERLAHHYDQFNYVHPFREGNGRTQRVFINRIARDAGWQLDWRPVQGAANDAACRTAAEQYDLGPLRSMLDQIVAPAPEPAARDTAWAEQEPLRHGFSPAPSPPQQPRRLLL
jgi:cell filamentation protein